MRFIPGAISSPDLRDLPLLLGRFVKFSCRVMGQPSLQNLQNLRRRFTRGAHNKDTTEPALVFSIRLRQSHPHGIVGIAYLLLLLRRPFYRLGGR